MFIVSRFITGFGLGELLAISTLYTTEVAPPHKRGLLASITPTAYGCGYLTSVPSTSIFKYMPSITDNISQFRLDWIRMSVREKRHITMATTTSPIGSKSNILDNWSLLASRIPKMAHTTWPSRRRLGNHPETACGASGSRCFHCPS